MLQKIVIEIQKQYPSAEVRVVSLGSKGEIGRQLESKGVWVCELNLRSGLVEVFRGFYLLMKEYQRAPSIVQSWMYHADFICSVYKCFFWRTPLVWGLRNGTLKLGDSSFITVIIRRFLVYLSHVIPARIISCSRNAINHHKKIGYKKAIFEFIPNGIIVQNSEGSGLSKSSQAMDIKSELSVRFLVGMVARFSPQKNFVEFFQMAGCICRCKSDVGFVLVGKGIADNEELKVLARENGVLEKTIFFEALQDINKIYRSLDVHVVTSRYGEGFPNVILESLYCGIRNFAFDVGDTSLIAPSNMVSICDNATEMASAIMLFLESLNDSISSRDLALRMKSFVSREYNIETVVRKYMVLYEACGKE